jgi:hypothetical protein
VGEGYGKGSRLSRNFVYFQKAVFVLVAVRSPNFTYFMTVLADRLSHPAVLRLTSCR